MFRYRRQADRLCMLESATGTGPRLRSPWLVAQTQKAFGERLQLHCKDLKMGSMKIPPLEMQSSEFRY
jgi:hypothetical protein